MLDLQRIRKNLTNRRTPVETLREDLTLCLLELEDIDTKKRRALHRVPDSEREPEHVCESQDIVSEWAVGEGDAPEAQDEPVDRIFEGRTFE